MGHIHSYVILDRLTRSKGKSIAYYMAHTLSYIIKDGQSDAGRRMNK